MSIKRRRRDKVLSLRFTEKEKLFLDYIFNKHNQSNSDTFLDVMKYYYENVMTKEKNINE